MTTLLDQHPNHTSVMLIWESQRTCKDVETPDLFPAHRKQFALLNPLPGVSHLFHKGGRLDIIRLVFWSQHHPPTTNITRNHQSSPKKNRSAKGEIQSLCRRLDGTSVTWVRLTTESSTDRYIFFISSYISQYLFLGDLHRFIMSTEFAEISVCQDFVDVSFRFQWCGGRSTVLGFSPMVTIAGLMTIQDI